MNGGKVELYVCEHDRVWNFPSRQDIRPEPTIPISWVLIHNMLIPNTLLHFQVLAFACLVALCVALPADDKTKEKKESADLTGAESAQFGYGGIGLGVPIGIGIGGLGKYAIFQNVDENQ